MKFVCYKTYFIYPGVFKIVKLGNNINVMIQISYNSEAVNDSDRKWLFQSFTLMKMFISTCENGLLEIRAPIFLHILFRVNPAVK